MTNEDLKTLPGWDELTAAGRVEPAGPETLARAQSAVQGAATADGRQDAPSRRRLVPVLAVVATAAVIAAGAVALGTGQDKLPVADGQPSTPVASGPRYLDGGSASCAFTYSPQRLKERAFAFDGTVVSIKPRPVAPGPVRSPRFSVMVTFTVNDWFKPGGGSQTQVAVPVFNSTAANGDAYRLAFKVGDRLLVSGEAIGSVNTAWACYFSRFYDEASAREWREAFGK